MKNFAGGASRDRAIRRLGQERALDRQLRGRSVQWPQQLRLHRRFRRGAHGALVACAGGPTGVGLSRRPGKAWPRFPRTRNHRAGPPRSLALDDGRRRCQPRRSHRGPEQGLAGRPPRHRGRRRSPCEQIEAERDGPCRDINFDPTVLPPVSGFRTIRSRPRGRPPTQNSMTVARRRLRTIPELHRTPNHDRRPSALYACSSACCTG